MQIILCASVTPSAAEQRGSEWESVKVHWTTMRGRDTHWSTDVPDSQSLVLWV